MRNGKIITASKMWFSRRTKRVTRAEGVDALRGGLE